MYHLPPPHSHHLNAAQGWLELGDHLAANDELEKIDANLRAHPEVLALRYQIFAQARKWEACVDLAKALTKLQPDDVQGWIHLGEALHQLKQTQEARDTLMIVVRQFSALPQIQYDLARYECGLGNLKAALHRLTLAIDLGGAEDLRLRALDDPDLERLWVDIGEI